MPHTMLTFELLTELQKSLSDLRVLLDQEREDIAGLNLKGLDERRPRIEALDKSIRSVSARVAVQIATACKESGLMGQENLSALISTLSNTERDRYSTLQRAIQKVSSDIDNALLVNRGLLEDSLAFANKSLAMFTGMLRSSSTYGQAGRFVETVDRSRIINREI